MAKSISRCSWNTLGQQMVAFICVHSCICHNYILLFDWGCQILMHWIRKPGNSAQMYFLMHNFTQPIMHIESMTGSQD